MKWFASSQQDLSLLWHLARESGGRVGVRDKRLISLTIRLLLVLLMGRAEAIRADRMLPFLSKVSASVCR